MLDVEVRVIREGVSISSLIPAKDILGRGVIDKECAGDSQSQLLKIYLQLFLVTG